MKGREKLKGLSVLNIEKRVTENPQRSKEKQSHAGNRNQGAGGFL